MKPCVATTAALIFSSLVAAVTPHSNPAQSAGKVPPAYRSSTRYWAGALQRSRGITEVSGSFKVPSVSLPAHAEPGVTYAGSAWVGIDDADTCSKQILQCGIEWEVDDSGVYYHAWYEWYPAPFELWDIEINEGDELALRVVAHSPTSGSVYLTNKSTGEKISHDFKDRPALCQGTAEWVVESYIVDGARVPMAHFSPVEFTGASYTHNRGHRDALLGASAFAMRPNGRTIITSQLTGHDSVRVQSHT